MQKLRVVFAVLGLFMLVLIEVTLQFSVQYGSVQARVGQDRTATPAPTVAPTAVARAQIIYRSGYTLNATDGTARNKYTVGNDTVFAFLCPAFTRAGDQIAVVGSGKAGFELYAAFPNGGGQRTVVSQAQLTNDAPGGSVTWSADGKLIAFTGVNGDQMYIVKKEGPGKNNADLTTLKGASFLNIDWSPDGTQFVAFALDADGQPGLFTMGADGQNIKRILALPLTDKTLTLNADHALPRDVVTPHWSPDGQRIAFASTINGALTLYTVKPDGSDVTRVLPKDNSAPSYAPYWSPDGAYLAYMSDSATQPGIYIVDLASAASYWIADVLHGGCPAWQPRK